MCGRRKSVLHGTRNQVSAAPDAVSLGSRFGEWQVCWLGGWGRNRLFYLVMLVKLRR
ncbi:MAG: hypothetical protein JWO19_3426 [Bryobacterales bacterium]|nr:hypothetical protein [Bryobacterales bacterium]